MANKIEDYLNGVAEKTSDCGDTGALGRYMAEEAQDAGTHEGAMKAAQTRKMHGGNVSVTINNVPRKYEIPGTRISPDDRASIIGLHAKGYETLEHPDHGVVYRRSGLVGHNKGAEFIPQERFAQGLDASWVEEQHHRSPNGRFSSGGHSGKQKTENEDGGRKHGSKGDGDKAVRKGEVEQDVAEKAVREAFEKSGGGLESMKLVGHHLSVKTCWKEGEDVDGRVNKINDVLKDHGLKAKVESGTTLHVAEDAGEEGEYDITNDPVTSVLVGICAVGMLAKDLHYRAKGKPFYGMHELSDVAWKIERHFDELNEVYFMGEKGVNPPERASVAAVAARIAGTPGDEDALIAALVDLLGKVAEFVESVKNSGVSGGTSAILDEVSKDALQAKGLLKRTQLDSQISHPASKQVDTSAIDKVIGKGLVIGGSASTAQDSGTHEGAIKAAQTRKAHRGGVDWSKVNLADGAKDWVDKDGIYLLHNKNGHFVSGHGQWGFGISTNEDYKNKAKRFSSEADADKFVRSHYGIAVGAPLSSSYTVMKGLPNLDNHPIWSKPENHRPLNDDGDSGYGPLPGSMT